MATAKELAATVGSTVATVFWTSFYFVYFLFKGKREWKCENLPAPTMTNCCVDGAHCSEHNGVRHRKPDIVNHQADHNITPKSFYSSNTGIRGYLKSTWQYLKNGATKLWENTKRVGRKVWNGVKKVGYFLWQCLRCIFAFIYAFFLSNNVPSQTLPSTPRPYTVKPASPSYNKVEFKFDENLNENELRVATKQEIQQNDEDEEEKTIYEDVSKRDEVAKKVPDTSESFYYERVFEEPKNEPVREKSVPPPPPPPPPKPVSREPSRARSIEPPRGTTPGRERKEVKGGIGGFKADIMEELEEQQRARYERASAQREMTQSCHPDMAQWKGIETVDRASANSTPWRASSVGPTMKKLEQVVSRVEGKNEEDEASFVFRPKIIHSSEEYQSKNKASNDFMMGRSVFSPVEEAEQMRRDINSKSQHQQSYSSPQYQSGNWMENQRSRNIHQRNDQAYDYQTKNPFGSAAYKSSPYASHTARRSKTPVRHGDDSGVDTIARQWPPVSNATGAQSAARDDWIGKSMRGEEDDNGLVMTMCRRVVEKKKDENWKWKDENGRLLDEKNHNTWKGELDTLLRDGPNEGRHWSRTVEKMPTGDTRFQDVNRQYNKEYVVESIVRNY